MSGFLHGIETKQKLKGSNPSRDIPSSVILLVGTAPIQDTMPGGEIDGATWYDGLVNQPILITEDTAEYYFGAVTGGYTIPSALRAIFNHINTPVVVVNVFDPSEHLTGENPDPAKVVAADIIGTSTPRTGLQFIKELYSRFGFTAKLILCPRYNEEATVRAEMISLAEANRAMALIDSTGGMTVQEAITARGTGGAYNNSSYRCIPCYMRLKNGNDDEYLSSRLAGVIAKNDDENGYWWSPSNNEIQGVTGVDRHLSSVMDDSASDLNLLNAAGWVTVYNSYGTGYRIWGNRSAAFPTKTDPLTFIAVQRTADIIAETIELSARQHLDKPITAAIDMVLSDVNAFIRNIIGKGGLVDGKCTFIKSKNPTDQLAAGKLIFDYEIMPPTPSERISFEQVINTDLLSSITG